MARRKAVVVDTLDVVERNLLLCLPPDDWDIVRPTHREADFDTRDQFLSVDLLDRTDTEARLAELTDVTRPLHIAFRARPTSAEHSAPRFSQYAANPVTRRSSPASLHALR